MNVELSHIIDREAFLERLGGDEDLAKQLIDMLLRDLPKLSQAVTQAVGARQAAALERSAHALKGAVANFSAEPAVQAAQRLENMGRDGDLHGCVEAEVHLQTELHRLADVLPKLFASGPS